MGEHILPCVGTAVDGDGALGTVDSYGLQVGGVVVFHHVALGGEHSLVHSGVHLRSVIDSGDLAATFFAATFVATIATAIAGNDTKEIETSVGGESDITILGDRTAVGGLRGRFLEACGDGEVGRGEATSGRRAAALTRYGHRGACLQILDGQHGTCTVEGERVFLVIYTHTVGSRGSEEQSLTESEFNTVSHKRFCLEFFGVLPAVIGAIIGPVVGIGIEVGDVSITQHAEVPCLGVSRLAE